MAFSRRVFLSLLGFLPLLASRFGNAADAELGTPATGLVVVGGWILRRDEIDQVKPQ